MSVERIAQEFRHAALAAAMFVVLVAPPPIGAQGSGTITGTITTSARALPALRVTIDQGVCGETLPDESIVVSGAGALANAVVTLAGVKARSAPAAVGIVNDKCRFAPRVQVAAPNASVTTSSADPVLHTTHAQIGSRSLFNVAIPVPGIKITKPVNGTSLVRLSCNTHPWMRGWMVVTDEAAAVTGGDGRFTLTNVPAGTYEMRVWHEALNGVSQRVTVTAGQTATVNLTLK